MLGENLVSRLSRAQKKPGYAIQTLLLMLCLSSVFHANAENQ